MNDLIRTDQKNQQLDNTVQYSTIATIISFLDSRRFINVVLLFHLGFGDRCTYDKWNRVYETHTFLSKQHKS